MTNEYDEIIKAAVAKWWPGTDWLYLKAQRQAETGGEKDPVHAVSNTGAKGLFQLMPSVCAQFGISDPFNPKQNVDGGVRLMGHLWVTFMREMGDERMRFAWAAYNAGPDNIYKAQNIAKANGKDGSVWANVIPYLRLVDKPGGGRAMSDDSIAQVTDYVTKIEGFYSQLKAA